ncbi:hypothetical protein [Methylorubrum podarium]|jgi:hypothetical protein|uniref:hypothetical protein n=1 Tax=Methylorubrum podarium TaxID=200476 RepID=UPI001EE2250E|nr:hypothetical protein [Methylorubrum podarium]MDV2985764.1 hypothetical protein [Methylobacteriaceae bacterium AG10]GJE69248.1 hypothetical protein CHKEEEPN_0772 [Methylorubrum podarium]
MRIGRVHQRVVPRVRPAASAATRYDFLRAHHEGAATVAALATSTGITILILAARLFAV